MEANFTEPFVGLGCKECRESNPLGFNVSMAFQPIWDNRNQKVFSQEALVRGEQGQGAGWVFEQVNEKNLYKFDQVCRVKAIEMAARLGIDSMLNINFLPNAVYRPETCIRSTLEASQEFHFPVEKIIFEVTETEKVRDEAHLLSIFKSYKEFGFSTAIDDFGAGYSGLKLLTKFVPDFIKIDMEIIRDIHKEPNKFYIAESIFEMAEKIGVTTIVEGIETREEFEKLKEIGFYLFQGYYFSKPVFEGLAECKPEHYT